MPADDEITASIRRAFETSISATIRLKNDRPARRQAVIPVLATDSASITLKPKLKVVQSAASGSQVTLHPDTQMSSKPFNSNQPERPKLSREQRRDKKQKRLQAKQSRRKNR
jgi:hypothetical protein